MMHLRNGTAAPGIDLHANGDDPRVNEDTFAAAIRACRSQIGACRPDDDEPEDQWLWDKLTCLLDAGSVIDASPKGGNEISNLDHVDDIGVVDIQDSPKGGSDALTIPEPHLECYSNNDGDSWYEHPADYELVQGLKVGDTYTLDVSHYSVERTYRVTKAPDETSDDYEVEPVQATSAEAGKERCESGSPDCGPAEHWDSEAVPLCARCWKDLTATHGAGVSGD